MKKFKNGILLLFMLSIIQDSIAQTIENGVGLTKYLAPLDSKFAIGETNAGIAKLKVSGTNQIDLAINALSGISDFTLQIQGQTKSQFKYSQNKGFSFEVNQNNTGGGGIGLAYTAMFVDGFTQYIGIGTGQDSPGARLHIKDDGEIQRIETTGTTGFMSFRNSTDAVGFAGIYSNTDDMDIGTSPSNTTGDLNLVTAGSPALTVAADGDVGIGDTTPDAGLDVEDELNTNVIRGESTFEGNSDRRGVYGRAVNNPGFGYGGDFEGGYRGVRGSGFGSTYTGTVSGVYGIATGSAGTRQGVYGIASSAGGVAAYGLYGTSSGSATTNYGVYGIATGGGTNWAGYFAGNTRIENGILGLWDSGSSEGIHMALTNTGDYMHYIHDSTSDTIMTINGTNERIGIRNTNPSHTMDITHISGVPSANSGNGLTIRNVIGSGDDHWTIYNWSSGNLSLYKAGDLRGTFSATDGMYTPTSDRRLKNDIEELPSQIEKIMELKPSTYTFKDQEGKEKSYGLIAQEVKEIYPELAPIIESTSEGAKQDLYGVTYTAFVPVLIKGIQELNSSVQEKDEAIEELTNQVALLEDKISKIENLDAVLDQMDALEGQLQNLEAMQIRIQDLEKDLQSCCLNSNAGTKEVSSTLVEISGTDQPALLQNAPNPFSQETSIQYYLPKMAKDAYILFTDHNGRTLKMVRIQETGAGNIVLKANELASGTYNYTLVIDGEKITTKQMILTR